MQDSRIQALLPVAGLLSEQVDDALQSTYKVVCSLQLGIRCDKEALLQRVMGVSVNAFHTLTVRGSRSTQEHGRKGIQQPVSAVPSMRLAHSMQQTIGLQSSNPGMDVGAELLKRLRVPLLLVRNVGLDPLANSEPMVRHLLRLLLVVEVVKPVARTQSW